MREWNEIEKNMKTVVNTHETAAPEFIWAAIQEDLDKSRGFGKTPLYILGLALCALSIAFIFKSIAANSQDNIQPNNLSALPILLADNSESGSTSIIVDTETKDLLEKPEKSYRQEIYGSTKSNASYTTTSTSAQKELAFKKDSPLNDNIDDSFQKKLLKASPNASSLKSVITKNVTANHSSGNKSLGTLTRSNLDLLDPIINSLTPLSLEREKLEYTDGIECFSFSDGLSIHPFIEVNGILGRHFKSLKPKQITEGLEQVLVDSRKETESSWYNFGGQVHLGLNINRNLYFGTGLEWNQSKDKFKYENEGITKIVIDLDEEGNPIDTSLVSGMFVSSGEVRYNMLDIPVFVGLTRSMGSWDFGIEGSALFNLSFSSKGKIINELSEIKRTEDTPLVYKEKVGMGFKGSVVLRKYLNSGIAFQIKPSFKTYLGDVTQSTYPVKTNLKFTRIDIGFRKDF